MVIFAETANTDLPLSGFLQSISNRLKVGFVGCASASFLYIRGGEVAQSKLLPQLV